MKNLIFINLIFFSVRLWSYPSVVDWRNSPKIVFENKQNLNLKKKEALKSPFVVETLKDDEIRLKVNSQSDLFVYPKSKMQISEVFEEDEALTVFLMSGTFRLSHSTKLEKKILSQVKNVFFELNQPPESDAIIVLNLDEPSVEIKMIKGQWDLNFFYYEKNIKLKAGQKVKFVGVKSLEAGQIKYDYLLDNKKVPKGKLLEIQKFDVTAFLKQEKAVEQSILKKHLVLQKKIQEEARKKKEYEDSFLCKKPFAQVNQCAWIMEDSKCYRQRCNVSGQWGDKTERPVTDQCTDEFLIGKCDY